jgi:putative transposase
MMESAGKAAPEIGVKAACEALGLSRATFGRRAKIPFGPPPPGRAPKPARSLSEDERRRVLDELHSERFADKAPLEVWATLLDEGTWLCSARTMYRILDSEKEVKERRDQLRHPQYKKPELLSEAPNQVWSWDITKLKGPAKWTCYQLYVIMDIFSRCVVGWMIAGRESAELARRLIEDSIRKQGIGPGQLTIHADRGASMKSKPVALLMADLGVTKTHSRPHVSDDNPYSESQFKTMKCRPEFPSRFGSIEDARAFCVKFFDWYNREHRHTGIGLLTPETVHYGRAEGVIEGRQRALDLAYAKHPERFVKKPPTAPELPGKAWINPPAKPEETNKLLH